MNESNNILIEFGVSVKLVRLIEICLNETYSKVCIGKQLSGTTVTVTNQNLVVEEIKRRLNTFNACYYSVPNLLSPCLLSKNVKIRIYM
jgi:hypothetical protein